MGNPRLLVDNLFNTRIYTSHVVTALENSTDAPLVGAGRRSTYDAYNSTTTNSEAWVKVRCSVPRAVDMVVVERGHNQGGATVKVQCSDDDFTTIQDAFNGVTPSQAGAGNLSDALGVRSREGAWLKTFSWRAAEAWRYDVPALGSGIVATIPGLWMGTSWTPGPARLPFAPNITELIVEETQSDLGWTGRGKGTPRRSGTIMFRFATLFDAEVAFAHLDNYMRGHPMWIVPDEERAESAFLAIRPQGTMGIEHPAEAWMYPVLQIPFRELDPLES